jgi:hypothetical protein
LVIVAQFLLSAIRWGAVYREENQNLHSSVIIQCAGNSYLARIRTPKQPIKQSVLAVVNRYNLKASNLGAMMKSKLVNFLLLGSGLVILLAAIVVRGNQLNQATAANGYPAPEELSTATISVCDQEKALNASRPPDKPVISEQEYQQCVAALTAAPNNKVLKPVETPLPTSVYKETRL